MAKIPAPKLSKTAQKGYSWVVNWWEGAARQRKFFRERKLAVAFLEGKRVEAAHQGEGDAPVTGVERAAVFAARRAGVELGEAVRWAVERAARPEHRATLKTVVEWRLAAVGMARRSVRYQASLRTFFAGLVRRWGAEREVASLGVAELTEVLFLAKAAGSVDTHRRYLNGLLAGAVARGVITENPLGAVPAVAPDDEGEVVVLTVAEAQGLWMACDAVDPGLLPWLGVALWAGLRPAELERVGWVDCRRGTGMLLVSGRKAKTRQRRLVTIEEPLRMALERREGAMGGLLPTNHRRRWEAVRVAAGWAGRDGKEGKIWPRNAMRHSFVSYHLAFFQDAGRTALEAGHSQDMLFRHYRQLVSPSDAAAWWAGWVME